MTTAITATFNATEAVNGLGFKDERHKQDLLMLIQAQEDFVKFGFEFLNHNEVGWSIACFKEYKKMSNPIRSDSFEALYDVDPQQALEMVFFEPMCKDDVKAVDAWINDGNTLADLLRHAKDVEQLNFGWII